jgi:hypothetical protein
MRKSSRSRWSALVAALVLAVVGTCLSPISTTTATAAAAATGRVRGAIVGQGQDVTPKIKLRWFDANWTYLGARKASGGGYSLQLAPGTYHLQFVDERPAYDVTKYYPQDVTVEVRAGATAVKNVRMKRGAAIGGTVRAGGAVAGGARVVAANTDENSFEVTANDAGQYALGGLPPGSYSVFTYDKKKTWVAKSLFLPKMKAGSYKNADIRLTKKAGRMIVDVYAGDTSYPGRAFVTAVSRKNGQFWTEKLRHGTVTFQGLYPGKYDLVVPGVGNFLGDTLKVRGKVKSGRTSFGSARLTKRGATVTGRIVDKNDPAFPLSGATVVLVDGAGHTLGTVTSATNGTFTLGGQLVTRSDLSVRAGPGPYSPYLGQGTHYCKYGTAVRTPVSVVTGQAKALGDVLLPHLPNAEQDGVQCHTPPPAP